MKRKAGEIFIRRTGNKGPIWQQEKNLWQDKQGINWREWWVIEKLKKIILIGRWIYIKNKDR